MTTTLERTTELNGFYSLPGAPDFPDDDARRLAWNGYGELDQPDYATPTASGEHYEGRAEVYYHGHDRTAVLALTDDSTWTAYVVYGWSDAVDLALAVFNETTPVAYGDDGEEIRTVPAMLATLATLPGVAFADSFITEA